MRFNSIFNIGSWFSFMFVKPYVLVERSSSFDCLLLVVNYQHRKRKVITNFSMTNSFICRYFATLQRELEPYDCVLYEMVASRESLESRRNLAVKKNIQSSKSRGLNILGCIQRQMARLLTLDFQLDCLDYQAENWYHADLDFETFKLLQVLHL